MSRSIFLPILFLTSALLNAACSGGGTSGGNATDVGGSTSAGPGATVTGGGGSTVGPGGVTSAGSNTTSGGTPSSAGSGATPMIGTPGDGYLVNGNWHGYAWTDAVPKTATTTIA